MNRAIRTFAVGVATVAAIATPCLVAQSADAMPGDYHLSAHPSRTSVASHQQFAVHGRLKEVAGVPGRSVWLQTKLHGHWHRLRGTALTTSRTGHYRVHVVLNTRGDRTLRAVSPWGAGLKIHSEKFVVRVR